MLIHVIVHIVQRQKNKQNKIQTNQWYSGK